MFKYLLQKSWTVTEYFAFKTFPIFVFKVNSSKLFDGPWRFSYRRQNEWKSNYRRKNSVKKVRRKFSTTDESGQMQSRRLSLSLFQHFRTILILTYISILYSRGGQTFLIAGQVRRLFFISGCTIHNYCVNYAKQNFFHPIFAYFFILDAFWYKMWCFLILTKGPRAALWPCQLYSFIKVRLLYFNDQIWSNETWNNCI